MEIWEIARMVRNRKGLTQKEFAELIGWGLWSYRHFEQNKILKGKTPNPPLRKLQSLAAGCGGLLTITLTRE